MTLRRFLRIFNRNPQAHKPLIGFAVVSLALAGMMGYLSGSFPTAFLLVHWKSKVDIRSVGSGNVGTLNSYEVTGSRFVGALTLLLDYLKGFAVVLLAGALWDGSFPHQAWAGVGALAGHNFPLWLGGKGGRGLATGCGVFSVLGAFVVPFWGVAWGIGFVFTRRVNPANVVATLSALLLVALCPEAIIAGMLAPGLPVEGFRLFSECALGMILVKHVQPIREYIRERRASTLPPEEERRKRTI